VTPKLPRRASVPAGVALAGAALAAAFGAGGSGSHQSNPRSAPAPGGGWYSALVAVDRAERPGVVTACGLTLSSGTRGVVHPLLPCGTRLVLSHRGSLEPARVVDRVSPLPGQDFAVTPGLARRLRLSGTARVDWRFALPPSR